MMINNKSSFGSTVTIIAVLLSVVSGARVTTREDCQRMLKENVDNIVEQTKLKVDVETIRCGFEVNSPPENPVLFAKLAGKKFKFFGVSQEDIPKVEMYKESGIGLDVLFVGTSGDFNLYICALDNYYVYKWDQFLSIKNEQIKIRFEVVKKIRDMAAKNIYPQANLPEKIYFDEKAKRVALMSDQDLQKENPQTVHTWVSQLTKAVRERIANIADPKLKDKIDKAKKDLDSFIETPSTDPDYLNKLVALFEKTDRDIESWEAIDKRQLDEELMGLFKEAENKKYERETYIPTSSFGYSMEREKPSYTPQSNYASYEPKYTTTYKPSTTSPAYEPSTTSYEYQTQERKSHIDTGKLPSYQEDSERLNALLNKNNQNKNVKEEKAGGGFDYLPYALAIVGLLGLGIAVVVNKYTKY